MVDGRRKIYLLIYRCVGSEQVVCGPVFDYNKTHNVGNTLQSSQRF